MATKHVTSKTKRDAFGCVARQTWCLTQLQTRLHEVQALNSTDRRRAEASKRLIAVRQDPNFGITKPVSSRVAKFERQLEADLARSSKREQRPSSSGGGGAGAKYRRKTKF